jgi:hypothetical protein
MPSAPSVGDAAVSFTLEDQFQTAHEVAFDTGAPVVIVFADRSCTDDVEPWARALADRLGGAARVLGVAAVGGVPVLFQGAVRGFLRDKPSVLLDWGNRVSDAFGYEGGACLVVAVDAAGTVRARVPGAFGEAGYAEVARAVGAA